MFVTNWISTTKIQKISEITNFFRHYFLSRTEVYITILKASKGVFIAPLSERQQNIPKSLLNDSSAALYILGIEICKMSTSYADFCETMKAKEAFFVDTLRQL